MPPQGLVVVLRRAPGRGLGGPPLLADGTVINYLLLFRLSVVVVVVAVVAVVAVVVAVAVAVVVVVVAISNQH